MTRALDWLHPTAVAPLRGLRGKSPEAAALRRDGLVLEVWPGVVRARDLDRGAAARSEALAQLVPSGAVLAYQAAVWVHTGRYRPERLDVVLTRGRHPSTPLVRMHAERLPPADVVSLGGQAVTSPVRTAIDVARRSGLSDAADWLAALRAHGLTSESVGATLERAAGLRGAPRARALLETLLADSAPVA